jgi:hypothetical protein
MVSSSDPEPIPYTSQQSSLRPQAVSMASSGVANHPICSLRFFDTGRASPTQECQPSVSLIQHAGRRNSFSMRALARWWQLRNLPTAGGSQHPIDPCRRYDHRARRARAFIRGRRLSILQSAPASRYAEIPVARNVWHPLTPCIGRARHPPDCSLRFGGDEPPEHHPNFRVYRGYRIFYWRHKSNCTRFCST